MQGRATLTFDDGSTHAVSVDLRFHQSRGMMAGTGTIEADDVMTIGMKDGGAVLSCGGQKIRVIITSASSDGTGTIRSTGAPIR